MIVIIGDVVKSKEMTRDRRGEVQELLLQQIERVNSRSTSIVSPFTITLGDEFQAVYSDVSSLLDDCFEIAAQLYPVKVRFSISMGDIATALNKKQALGMDGPAFHEARNGMNELKQSGQMIRVQICHASKRPETQAVTELINHSLDLLSATMKRWKGSRYKILVMLNKDHPVKKIAERLGISESAVYKNREDGNLELVIHLKDSITRVMQNELQRMDTI